MKKQNIIILVLLSLLFLQCRESDKIASSGEDLFQPQTNSEIDKQLRELFREYNTRIEYRYIKNYIPGDWYYITPVKEELVVPMSKLVKTMWLEPLLAGANRKLVSVTFPKMLIYIGSPALQRDGTRVLGQAEGGTLIRFTEVNSYDSSNKPWVNTQMHTAFHEYGHVIHQRFGFPEEYQKISPESYTLNGWRTISSLDALRRGMVSSYATKSPQEDFVELFATYVIGTDKELEFLFKDAEKEATNNRGRAILRNKLAIQKKYMKGVGIDMDLVRKAYQEKIANL